MLSLKDGGLVVLSNMACSELHYQLLRRECQAHAPLMLPSLHQGGFRGKIECAPLLRRKRQTTRSCRRTQAELSLLSAALPPCG
eukprot:3032825-Amphidinium_carterae.1